MAKAKTTITIMVVTAATTAKPKTHQGYCWARYHLLAGCERTDYLQLHPKWFSWKLLLSWSRWVLGHQPDSLVYLSRWALHVPEKASHNPCRIGGSQSRRCCRILAWWQRQPLSTSSWRPSQGRTHRTAADKTQAWHWSDHARSHDNYCRDHHSFEQHWRGPNARQAAGALQYAGIGSCPGG